MPTFYEFFAGGGMARAGLGRHWECLFANDFDPKKGAAYTTNWGSDQLKVGDVAILTASELPGIADLVWGSFPCQDLSLAGGQAGLRGDRSGTFWPFYRLMTSLSRENRIPGTIVLENVCGALSSHEGTDFASIGEALSESGYRYGALVIDAVRFVPQSRPRLFFVGVQRDRAVPADLKRSSPDPVWHPSNLVTAYEKLSRQSKDSWIWWDLPRPAPRMSRFVDIIEDEPKGVRWHTDLETRRLLDMMTPLNSQKVEKAIRSGRRVVGGLYRRTRANENGVRVQRAEVRFDDISGCLRTPAGGSSRQIILVVEGKSVRSRLLSPREAARLMGLPESYKLPGNYNEAYHLLGDGVVVPVVRFLAANLVQPLVEAEMNRGDVAA
jgi:DNA (cytosine-5)-methyltransferase 1